MTPNNKNNIIYLDHAASTSMTSKALEVLLTASQKGFANPAAQHQMGRVLQKKIDLCRQEILQTLNADSSYKVIFTSSATESNNMVIRGLNFASANSSNLPQILFSEADHPSIVTPVHSLKRYQLMPCQLSHTEKAKAETKKFLKKVTPYTKLILLSHVNNTSGYTLPINELALSIKAINSTTHIHLDASQSFCKLPINLKDSSIDSISLSAHKMGGPKGVGALVIKKDISLTPLFYGGGHEDGLRPSTQPLPLILSWTAAIKEQYPLISKHLSTVKKIYSYLREELTKNIPHIKFLSHLESSSPYILSIILPEVFSDIMMRQLEESGVITSTSSACSSKNKKTNPTFTALGINEKLHRNILRISFSSTTSMQEIHFFSDAFNKIYNELRRLS